MPLLSQPQEKPGCALERLVEDAVQADSAMTEAEAMRRRMQLTLSAEIPILSIICFVSLRPLINTLTRSAEQHLF